VCLDETGSFTHYYMWMITCR